MIPSSHYQYPSAEAEYALYNFHSQQQVDDLADVLASNDTKAPRVINLVGESGSGRHYLLRAAAHYARQRGARVAVEELILDGYEPDAPLRFLLAHLSERATGEVSGKFSELARRAKVEIRVSPVNLILASIGVKTDLTVQEISDFLQPTIHTRGPDLSDRERLRNFLNLVTHRRRLALYIRDSQIVDVGLRLRLVDEAVLNANLLVAFGYPPESAGALNPEREPFRLEVQPWTRKEMQRAFAERFQPNEAAADFLDFAWNSGLAARNRETFAQIVLRAVRSGCLLADSADNWYVEHNWKEQKSFVQEFSRDLYEPVLQIETQLVDSGFPEERIRAIRDFVRAAALCDPTIPVFPLLTMIGVSEAEKQDFVDCLDDVFKTEEADGILEDLGFRHPGFPPSQLIYRFRNPIMSRMVLERLADSPEWAGRVLKALQKTCRPDTRAIANLYLRLVQAARLENEATRYEKLLSYWTSVGEMEALSASVLSELNAHKISPHLLWSVIEQSCHSWPPAKQLALLEAYGNQKDGIPFNNRYDYFLIIANALFDLGRCNEAVDAVAQAKISEWPEPKWHCAMVLHVTLSQIEVRRGRLQEADKRAVSALRIAQANLAWKHPEVAGVLHNLGNVRYAKAQYRDARKLLLQALAIREEIFGPKDTKVGITLNNLGVVLFAEGQHSDARQLYERALAIHEEAFGPNHPEVATTLNHLGSVLNAEKQHTAARRLFERALAIREETLGPNHPEVAATLNQLGKALIAEGPEVYALRIMEQALAIRRGTSIPKLPGVATTLRSLGNVLHPEGPYGEARQLFQRALAIHEEAFGPKHPDVATTLNNLAYAYMLCTKAQYGNAQYGDARELLLRALAIQEEVFGPKHPEVATTLNHLGSVLNAEKQHAAARRLFERALAIREETLGPSHPDVADTLNQLGKVLNADGLESEARLLFQRASAIREEMLQQNKAAGRN